MLKVKFTKMIQSSIKNGGGGQLAVNRETNEEIAFIWKVTRQVVEDRDGSILSSYARVPLTAKQRAKVVGYWVTFSAEFKSTYKGEERFIQYVEIDADWNGGARKAGKMAKDVVRRAVESHNKEEEA